MITEIAVPASGGITAGPDGNIWVTEDGKIAQFVLDGKPANPNVNQFVGAVGHRDHGDHEGPRRQPLLHRDRRRQDRRDHPGRRRHRVRHPDTQRPAHRDHHRPRRQPLLHRGRLHQRPVRQLHIGRITPTGKITEFSLGFSVFAVGGITAGPDGNVYFTVGDNNGEQVGRITPAGNISFLAVPGGIDPGAITTGPDGNLWVTDPDDSQIIRLTTPPTWPPRSLCRQGTSALRAGSRPGPTATSGSPAPSFIGRITTKGAITEFALPTKDSSPGAITAGPDGNLYFAESSPGAGIGRITTSGVITEIPVPASGGITAGPDGNIWVTEDGKVARLLIPQPPVTLPAVPASSVKAATDTVTNSTTQGATVDAAIRALFPGVDQGSVTASGDQLVVVSSTTLSNRHKKA